MKYFTFTFRLDQYNCFNMHQCALMRPTEFAIRLISKDSCMIAELCQNIFFNVK